MKIIIVSEKFPRDHPKEFEPTYFVEKILLSLGWEFNNDFANSFEPKGHTIRAGNRWKVGEMASLRNMDGKALPK